MHLPHRPSRRVLGAVLAGGLLAVTSVGAVFAAPLALVQNAPAGTGVCVAQAQAARANASIDDLRAFGDCEIDRRFTTLDKLASALTSSKALTSAHRSALQTIISNTRSGLTNLKAAIDAETSKPAVTAEIHRIATDYRVYLLVVPQVHLVNAADRVAAAGPLFDKVAANLSERIADAKAAGKDVTTAQGYLEAMSAAVGKAESLASPVAGQVLPLTPSQYNGGTAGPVLQSARASIVQAAAQIRIARQDAEACRAALAALK